MNQVEIKYLTNIINCYGILDSGSQQLWELFDEFTIKNFGKLKKLDFDMCLAGFMSITSYDCSMKLQVAFEQCIMRNYGSNPEEFVFSINYVGK